jgi:D-alanyl-D-alanine carboxypeptidase
VKGKKLITTLGLATFLLVLTLVYGWSQYSSQTDQIQSLNQELNKAQIQVNEYASTTVLYEERIASLEGQLEQTQEELEEKIEIIETSKDTVDEIATTIQRLDKLSRTDPELLAKYSKVYFLNENYIPERLTTIPIEYVYNTDRIYQIHSDVWPKLQDLLEDAEEDGVVIKIISAYRSFGTQAALKSSYEVTYGTGANTFSADQGYSEHQLGTTVDFTTTEVGPSFTGFEDTTAYDWLLENAYKYGFILSYPEGNSYYQYEPWHWRFVGEKLADDLHDQQLNFYDLDQRSIDQYLVDIFD